MHNYTVGHWPPSYASVGFGETEYSEILKSTLEMEGLINKHSAIMDKYDPDKKVALVVDEWGGWYAPLAGSNPGFLVQQNSLRDAILAARNLNIFARHADRVPRTLIQVRGSAKRRDQFLRKNCSRKRSLVWRQGHATFRDAASRGVFDACA